MLIAPPLGMTAAEILGYGVLAILLVVIFVSVRVVMECVRHHYANPFLMGFLMLGSSVGSVLFILLSASGIVPHIEGDVWIPRVGLVVWIFSLVFYTITSHATKRREESPDADLADWQRDLERGAISPYDVKQLPDEPNDMSPRAPIAAAVEEPRPRRAISLPANESDGSARASEQTLKRMTAAQIEADAKLKGPRADEVAGNPILPDGEVKIRCLGCDKKMKADASKFRKQRRCPACKVEPFHYVTAI